MKKVLSAILSCAICLGLSTTAMAVSEAPAETTNVLSVFSPESAPSIYSPEFPDAYILPNEMSISDSTTQTVSATVFVEEEYGFDDSGNPVTISSRLLSESEVLEIGLENFENMEDARQDAVSELMQTRAAVNARGSLKISFSEEGYITGNSLGSNKVTYDLSANASWSPSGLWGWDGANNPADGNDYIGVIWSGGFSCPSCSITPSYPKYAPAPYVNMCNSFPNVGRVWEFSEKWIEYTGGGTNTGYHLTSLDLDITLTKNNVREANQAEAVLQYTHTWQSTTGSVSISVNGSGVGGGFVLNNVSKQWSIVCTLTGFWS